MSALRNQRWELFAQALAKGETIDDAYVSAGYSRNPGNAGRLNKNEEVRARVAELQGKTAQKTKITAAGITERLLRIADKAEKLGSATGLNASRAALMDAAKLNGLVIDKFEGEVTERLISDKPMSAQEWATQFTPAEEMLN